MEYREAMRSVCIWLAMAPLTWAAVTAGCASAPEVGSIGARLARDNDSQALFVREVPEGYAASEAGLEPGDEIVMIDGNYVRTLPSTDLEAKLRGPIGSSVSLTLTRGNRVLHVDLKRSPLHSGAPVVKPKEQRINE